MRRYLVAVVALAMATVSCSTPTGAPEPPTTDNSSATPASAARSAVGAASGQPTPAPTAGSTQQPAGASQSAAAGPTQPPAAAPTSPATPAGTAEPTRPPTPRPSTSFRVGATLRPSSTHATPKPSPAKPAPTPQPTTGGVAKPTPGSAGSGFPAAVLDPILADAAARAGTSRSAITVVEAETRTWPDAGLGCPMPGMAYAQVQVDGYRVVVSAGSTTYDYRGSAAGKFRLCSTS